MELLIHFDVIFYFLQYDWFREHCCVKYKYTLVLCVNISLYQHNVDVKDVFVSVVKPMNHP